jgi:hypothetical protein
MECISCSESFSTVRFEISRIFEQNKKRHYWKAKRSYCKNCQFYTDGIEVAISPRNFAQAAVKQSGIERAANLGPIHVFSLSESMVLRHEFCVSIVAICSGTFADFSEISF